MFDSNFHLFGTVPIFNAHWLSQIVCVVLIPKTHTILPTLKISEAEIFTKCFYFHEYMPIHDIYFKQISACSKVFVECVICYGELKDASLSF